MSGRTRIATAAVGLLLAGVLGAALAIGGAALLVGFGGETTTQIAGPAVAPQEQAAFRNGKALSINQIYRRSAPGVVQVTSTSIVRTETDPLFGFPFPQQETQRALGSGFVIDKAGHIITNYHVIQGAREVQVSFSNNENMKARIVGSDPSTDIAVLQVNAHSR